MVLYLGLRRRGFMRVATVSTMWMPRRQHAVGLLAGHNSAEIEKALGEISPLLGVNATVAFLVDSDDSSSCASSGFGVRAKLQQMGFRVEAGVRCHQGLVISACRQGFGQVERAA
jgi:phosphoserine phosphatase